MAIKNQGIQTFCRKKLQSRPVRSLVMLARQLARAYPGLLPLLPLCGGSEAL